MSFFGYNDKSAPKTNQGFIMFYIFKKALFQLTTLSLLIGALSSCATMSVQECQVANWYGIGYKDGVNGEYPDHIMTYSKACLKGNITPNQSEWERGRKDGLKQYCTADHAYQVGLSGKALRYVCPSEQQSLLDNAQEHGYTIYTANKRIGELQRQIEKDEKEIQKLLNDYDKLRNGDNLGFANEKEARTYLLEIPNRIKRLRLIINESQSLIQNLVQSTHHYKNVHNLR